MTNYQVKLSFEIVSVHNGALVFIFIGRLRFPSGLLNCIVELLPNRYGTDLIKNVRKLQKIDCKYCKLQLDFDFLQTCTLEFKLENGNFRFSSSYSTCQKILLKEAISI